MSRPGSKSRRRWWPVLLLLPLGAALMITSCTSPQVGLVDGRLRPCPSTPNCVCSQDDAADPPLAPLDFQGEPADAWQRLRAVAEDMARTTIVEDTGRYMHVEFRSALFRFVDDVEFLLDAEGGVIHVRSASRLGYSDLGVNRRRVERIREAFAGT